MGSNAKRERELDKLDDADTKPMPAPVESEAARLNRMLRAARARNRIRGHFPVPSTWREPA